MTGNPTTSFRLLLAVAIGIGSACGGDSTDSDPSPTGIDSVAAPADDDLPTGITVGDEPATSEGAIVVAPAETGPLTDYDLGGLTLSYDASYWEIEPFGPDDPDDALVWFKSPATNAVIQLSFTNKELEPADDVCAEGYAGDADPARHSVTLLHEETLSNDGLLRIHEQDLDTSGDDAIVGISYAQLTFNPDDGRSVGDTFCTNSRWIEVSPRMRDDGSPVYYRIEAFFAFSLDFVFAPFKEQFDSADAMRQREGFAQMLALLETIEVAGTPV